MKALTVLKYVGFGILGILLVIGFVFGVQYLWNWLIPELFHGPVLSFWQAAGLFLLSKILLTGVAPGGSGNHGKKEWRRKYDEKYKSGCCENAGNITTENA
jgi:hypothetical protein